MKPAATPAFLSVRRHMMLGTVIAVLLLGGLGSWLAFARLSGAVIAQGRLSRFEQTATVQHLEGGRVREVLIHEGDAVIAGQALIRLDPGQAATRLARLEDRLFDLRARRARLVAERDGAGRIAFSERLLRAAAGNPARQQVLAGQERLFAAGLQAIGQTRILLDTKAAQNRKRISALAAQQKALRQSADILQGQLEESTAMAERGLMARSDAEAARLRLLNLQARIRALAAQQAEARVRLADIATARLKLETTRRKDALRLLRDIDLQTGDLAHQRDALADQLSRRTIRAPIAGIVLGLAHLSRGAVIEPAAPLMQIVPENRQYLVIARIPPSDIARLYPGQPARLRLTGPVAASAQDFSGQVHRISPDALSAGPGGPAYYRVEVTLAQQDETRLATRPDVVAGQPVETFIETGTRPAWAYLAAPLRSYFSHMFRES